MHLAYRALILPITINMHFYCCCYNRIYFHIISSLLRPNKIRIVTSRVKAVPIINPLISVSILLMVFFSTFRANKFGVSAVTARRNYMAVAFFAFFYLKRAIAIFMFTIITQVINIATEPWLKLRLKLSPKNSYLRR